LLNNGISTDSINNPLLLLELRLLK